VPVGQKLAGAALSSLRRPLIRQMHILDGAHDDGRQQASPRVVGAIVRYGRAQPPFGKAVQSAASLWDSDSLPSGKPPIVISIVIVGEGVRG
jgi:hypothetical protein